MTIPTDNNPLLPNLNSQVFEQPPVDGKQNLGAPAQPQNPTPSADFLRLMTVIYPNSSQTLQQRITLLESYLANPGESGNQSQVNAASWTLIVLHFFFDKLSSAVNDLVQNPTADNEQVEGKAKREKPVGAKEAVPFEEGVENNNPELKLHDLPLFNPNLSPKAKQELADTIIKSLLILQTGKPTYVLQGKEEVAQNHNLSSHIQLITQLSKMVVQIEELKILLQDPKISHPKAYLTLLNGRIEDTIASFGVVLTQPEMVEKMAQERLHQDAFLLTTLINAAKQEIGSAKLPSSASSPLAEPRHNPDILPSGVNLAKTPAMAQQPANFNPAAAPQAKMAAAPPIAVARPVNTLELVSLIQSHLNKGIMQPLPIIVPFPVTITMEEAINTTTSSSIGKEKRTKNEEGGNKGSGGGGSEFSILTMLLPAGPVIYGDHRDEGRSDEKPYTIEQLDAYLIAASPVTNAQYAAFLNDALEKNAVRIEMPGKIYDDKSRLLVMTIEGALLSQLEIASEGGKLFIRPIHGKDNHPVVHVTYDGALAYCIANGFRLPSEAEWERAAGMLPTEYGQPLKKLRYGSGSDSISSSQAVYKENGFEKVGLNMTMPVGFFDGQKVYTKAGRRVETKLSLSPWGCTDMSGNAREWTSTCCDEEDYLFATKGGSYADTAFDLRVAAKTPLPRHTSDPYTSFRVAL